MIRTTLALAVLLAPLAAQDPATAEETGRTEALCKAIDLWARAYHAGELRLNDPVRTRTGHNPEYVRWGRRAGLLDTEHPGSHLSSLHRLLHEAEKRPDPGMARGLLQIAAIGFELRIGDIELRQLRDLGHWALMRMEDQKVWLTVMRVAAWDLIPWTDKERTAGRTALQVAALRLLGQKNLPVFRSTVESQLLSGDPRVRLAASEALAQMQRPQSLHVLVRALTAEDHPVVAQAQVGAVHRIFDKYEKVLEEDQRNRVVGAVMRRLGGFGWRFDVKAVAFLEEYPIRAVVPALITALERSQGEPEDELVAAVSKRSSKRVRHRAWQALQGLVGTLIPADDPSAWREFWAREKDSIRVRDHEGRSQAKNRTRATFFGIPITGSEIAFLIDTSGSMDSPTPVRTEARGRTRAGRSGRGRKHMVTRLDAAKSQLLQAVEAMDPESRYHLFTFDSETLVWNRRAVEPGRSSRRSLTEVLGRFEASGGTNVWNALLEVLQAESQRYGATSENPVDELFVLSDGEPTQGVTDEERILEMVREANRYQMIRINTVFTGEGKGAEFLKELAAQNDGVFVQR